MVATKLKSTLDSIIRVRKRLIKTNSSGKNPMKCLMIIKEITIQMEAYGKKWNDEGWRNFVKRNIDSVEYLIPENKSGLTLKQKLHENL